MRFIVSIVGIAFLLPACGGVPLVPDLPEGEQTVTGVLMPAELSAVRRGTHLLLQDSRALTYVESTTVSLRPYQGKRITLKGSYEPNIAPSVLPVLVVDAVVSVEENTKEHVLRDLNLRMDVPAHWIRETREAEVLFRPEGSDVPLLRVTQEQSDTFPVGGVPIVIGGKRALRMTEEFGHNQVVAIRANDVEIVTVLFAPLEEHGDLESLKADFLDILNSIEFVDGGGSASSARTGTGALGAPCGGEAGILCPAGSYCEVSDLEENIGRCRLFFGSAE